MTTVQELIDGLEEIRAALESRPLTREELEALAAEITSLKKLLIRPDHKAQGLRSIRGVGKELWQNVDVREYIREERRSWR